MIPKLENYKRKWGVESDRSIKPGTQSIQEVLESLNNPHKCLQYVHFAGTNGKGSTLTFVEQIALKHGLTVGKFTSPCIIDVHDQIQINGENIRPDQLDEIFKLFKEAGVSGKLTDFELLTCATFVHFAKKQVDLVVLEAGMGGRYDSTNVITPIVSVIPSIALEHTNFLGTTIKEIAYHKAGIIKEYKDVVIGQLPQEALQVLLQEAQLQKSPVHVLSEVFSVEEKHEKEWYKYPRLNVTIGPLNRKMLGKHQANNMALAITAFYLVAQHLQIQINEMAVKSAVNEAVIPGRFEEVFPNVFFEGAHNPASIQALTEIITKHFSNKNIECVIGMLKDKDVQQVLQLIEPVATKISFIDIPNERALPAQDFYELSSHPNKEVIKDATKAIQSPLPENTIRIVTGSLYLLADLRSKIKKQSN